jgi:hypothetical protein
VFRFLFATDARRQNQADFILNIGSRAGFQIPHLACLRITNPTTTVLLDPSINLIRDTQYHSIAAIAYPKPLEKSKVINTSL